MMYGHAGRLMAIWGTGEHWTGKKVEPEIKWASEEEKREQFEAEINREWESWLKVQEVAE